MKAARILRLPIPLLLAAFLVFPSLARGGQSPDASRISIDRIQSTIAWLADPARAGRHAGSPGALASGDYIAARFREAGYDVQMQEFGGNRRNVVARFGKADKYIVIGAHYDGQGTGFPSASDNAAGIAVILELARALKEDPALSLSIVAIAFDDEEQGMNGSRYYVDHSPYRLEDAQSAIILDTLGRSFMDLPSWTLFVLGTEYSKELAAVVKEKSRSDLLVAGTDLIGPRSDFAAFAVKRIPYLFFTNATHRDYHGEGDTPARIDFARLGRDADLILSITAATAQLAVQPKYLPEPSYPESEHEALDRQFVNVGRGRQDLPEAYRLMFSDLRERLKTDSTRETPQIAATAFLALATPRLSNFMLSFMLGPFYEGLNKREIAAAIYEEAIKYSEAGAVRRDLEAKVRRLRTPPQ